MGDADHRFDRVNEGEPISLASTAPDFLKWDCMQAVGNIVAAGIIGSVTAGLALGGLLAAAPLRAEPKKRQVDEITWEEFLALDPDGQQRIAYGVDGHQPVGALVEECKATPRDTLWQKLKKQ